jgi:hypothetical protein
MLRRVDGLARTLLRSPCIALSLVERGIFLLRFQTDLGLFVRLG